MKEFIAARIEKEVNDSGKAYIFMRKKSLLKRSYIYQNIKAGLILCVIE